MARETEIAANLFAGQDAPARIGGFGRVVGDDDAFETTRALATKEGLFVGMSSGAAVVGAMRAAADMDSGTIVVILPDNGERYLSTALFRSVCAKCPP